MSILPTAEEKPVYVERMFARIADGYDRMNAIMTFGLDRGWRARAVRAVAPRPAGRALDLGTGTGDFLPLLVRAMPQGYAVGADFTVSMMRAGQHKLGSRSAFSAGDALALPFADASFDAIVTGFTVRNVADIGQAFAEMARVAAPGCRLACLEVARPRNPLVRIGHRFYFEEIVPQIARALGADPAAYTYLPQSARLFPPPPRLSEIMTTAGWHDVRWELLGFGAVALHTAIRR